MARLRTIQTNFAAGELSPLMVGRSDVTHYQGGAARFRNVAPLQHGGGRRRWGSKFIGATNGHTQARLVPFVFNDDQTNLFSFTTGRLTIYGAAETIVQNITDARLPITAELRSFQWAQSGDVMVLFHKDRRPVVLTRTAADTFAMSTFAFSEGDTANTVMQPYHKYRPETVKLTPSATTGAITLTASAAAFTSDQVGDTIRYRKKQITITGFTSGTVVTGTVIETLPSTTANKDWDEPMFSTRRGWPRTAHFHENRLWIGGGLSLPAAVAGSVVGLPFNFDVGTGLDDEAVVFSIGGERVATVNHITSSADHLQVFTDFYATFNPQSRDAAITPGTFSLPRRLTPGASTIRPRLFDGGTLYIQDDANVIRDFFFDGGVESYSNESISLLASHLIVAPLDMDVLVSTGDDLEDYALVVNGDGTMAVFHGNRAQRITAWSLWTTAGSYDAVAVVNDRAYVVVKRSINGTDERHIERLSSARFLDDGLDVVHASGFPGLGHLEGKTVAAMQGDLFLGRGIVAGGVLPATGLSSKALTGTVEIGLDFTPLIQSLPVQVAIQDGPMGAENRRLISASVRLDSTLSLQLDGRILLVRAAGEDLSLDPTPFTGWWKSYLLGWDRDGQFSVQQDDPGPLTVLAFVLEIDAR